MRWKLLIAIAVRNANRLLITEAEMALAIPILQEHLVGNGPQKLLHKIDEAIVLPHT